jgi:hypothetical protein|tara:strand:- start:714 stop:914 length:201 start_codon:yes stop_codon:yes gene_type:complete
MIKKHKAAPLPTIVMKGVLYLRCGSGFRVANGRQEWFHKLKNIQEGHKDFGKYKKNMEHDEIKLYL